MGTMAEPMYRQVARDIEQRIEDGSLQPGARLATELEMREEYEASRNTIRDAIRWLVSRGLVETRAGMGCFVARRLEPFVTTLSAEPEAESVVVRGENTLLPVTSRPRVEVHAAADNLATILRLREGARVVSRRYERFVDRVPWSLETSFYPMDLVARGAEYLAWAEPINQGMLAYLEEAIALKQVGHRDRLLIGPPDEAEARFFGLPEDGRIPVITILRTGYTDSPQGPVPFRVTLTVFASDRNQLVISSGEVPDMLDDATEPRRRVFTR
jgi:GntR family transcriptional regulator